MRTPIEKSLVPTALSKIGTAMNTSEALGTIGSCCTKALLGAALLLPVYGYAIDETSIPPQAVCEGDVEACIAAEAKANAAAEQGGAGVKPAYTLRILTYGESDPSQDNTTEEGLQQNRRVDVTVFAEPEIAENDSKVDVQNGGILWITKDPLQLNRQLQITAGGSVNTVDGELTGPVKLRLYSNYATYLSRWEVIFFDAQDEDQSDPVATIAGDKLGYENELEWNGVLENGETIKKGDELTYVLRVYDAADRFDETFPQTLSVLGPQRNIDTDEDAPTLEEQALEERKALGGLARSEVDIRGSRVRIYGRDLSAAQSLTINGERIAIDQDNAFAAEYLLPIGKHDFDVEIQNEGGSVTSKQMSVDLTDEYLFLIALADLTVGANNVSGAVDKLEVVDDDHYDGDIFVDGRLAFYLKGKIKGKYLVTAQMDTETQKIDKLFDNLDRTDPSSVFRRLDPEQYYPVYGDDSTIVDDTDSQGMFYVRVDWDQSRALWGKFNSGITGTELSRFNIMRP